MHVGGDGGRPFHGHGESVGVRLDLAVGDHPALLAGLRNEVPLTGPRRHARQQRDSGRPAVEGIAAALVEGQLVEHVGRHDHRDRDLLITLGDEQ